MGQKKRHPLRRPTSKRRALLERTAKICGTGEQVGLLDRVVQPELQVAAYCWHWEFPVGAVVARPAVVAAVGRVRGEGLGLGLGLRLG